MSIAPHLCPTCKERVWQFRGKDPVDAIRIDNRLADAGDTPPFFAHKGPGLWLRVLINVNDTPPPVWNGLPLHPAHHCPPPHRCSYCGNKHKAAPTRNQTIIKEQP